jgi:hypothetical protein
MAFPRFARRQSGRTRTVAWAQGGMVVCIGSIYPVVAVWFG